MQKLYFFLALFISVYSFAQDTMPSDTIDFSKGSIYISEKGYSVGSMTSDTIEHTGVYNIYSSADTANSQIYITNKAEAQEITLWNVKTSYATNCFYSYSGKDVTLNVVGDNTFISASASTPIYIKNPNSENIIINGDSLSVYSNGTKIIAGVSGLNTTSLYLNLKYLKMIPKAESNAIIGQEIFTDKQFKSVIIGDNCVFTGKGFIYADSIVIGKASVNVTSMSSVPYNTNGDKVYCVTVPRNGVNVVTVKNTTTGSEEDYSFTSAHGNDDNYYLYLPNGSYELSTNGNTYTAVVNGAAVIASVASIAGDGIIDVSSGEEVTINDSTYQIGIQPYTYTGRKFTFSGTTTATGVTVNGGADTLVFNGGGNNHATLSNFETAVKNNPGIYTINSLSTGLGE